MKTTSSLIVLLFAACLTAAPAEFADPVRLTVDGEPIAVESPGYACPTLADVNGDGKLDLVVGQFNKGKLHVFKNIGDGMNPKYAKGEMIEAEGQVAEVPGVW